MLTTHAACQLELREAGHRMKAELAACKIICKEALQVLMTSCLPHPAAVPRALWKETEVLGWCCSIGRQKHWLTTSQPWSVGA